AGHLDVRGRRSVDVGDRDRARYQSRDGALASSSGAPNLAQRAGRVPRVRKTAMDFLAEPKRDPYLARAIRETEGPPPGRARLELLRARIAAVALAAIEARRERTWWEWTSRWARTEVALAAAATILAAAIGGATTIGRGDITSDTTVAPPMIPPQAPRSE